MLKTSTVTKKRKIFRLKNSDNFHISAQNIDCGYLLEPPRQGGSNAYPQSMFLSRNKKIMYTPANPSFTIQKWGFRGLILDRHDDNCSRRHFKLWHFYAIIRFNVSYLFIRLFRLFICNVKSYCLKNNKINFRMSSATNLLSALKIKIGSQTMNKGVNIPKAKNMLRYW